MRQSLVDAGVGAAVTVVGSVVPFSPVAGGAVAATRRGGGYAGGLWVGALAGVAAAVPLTVLFVPALYIAGALGLGIPPTSPAYELFLAVAVGLFLLYTVGLSGVGGLCGVWIGRHTDLDLEPGRWL